MLSKRDKEALKETLEHYGYHGRRGLYRFSYNYFKGWFLEKLANFSPLPSMTVKFHRLRGINIGRNVYIGNGVIFDRLYPHLIKIEDYAEIGDNSIITCHSRGTLLTKDLYPNTVAPVTIKRGVWIMPGCIIIPGVTIGECSIVATGAVVTKDVAKYTLVAGVPAKVIKEFKHNE